MMRGSKNKRRPSALDRNDSRPAYLNRTKSVASVLPNTGAPGNEEEEVKFAIRSLKKQLDEYQKRELKMRGVNENLRKALKEKDAIISDLRVQNLEAMEKLGGSNNNNKEAKLGNKATGEAQRQESSEEISDLKESVKTIEKKLGTKIGENDKLTAEMVDLRHSLSQMARALKKMEGERNVLKTKVAELTKALQYGDGKPLTETEKNLRLRSAQVQELSALVDTLSCKLQEKDEKIMEVEHEHDANHALLKQLNNMFPGSVPIAVDGERLAAQTQSVLLLNMINMLNSIQNKSEKLQHEKEFALKRVAQLSVEIAESSAQLDHLNTKLRRAEARQTSSSPNFSPGQVLHRIGERTIAAGKPSQFVPSNERYNISAAGSSSRANRLMKYLKTNLTTEVDEKTKTSSLGSSQ